MVLNYKPPSSIQEVSVGNGEGKAGLKRKLTGPPRLLLGKSKAKSDLETREDTPRMANEGSGYHRGTVLTQQSTIQEERSPGCISENQEKPVESGVKQTTPENKFETEGWCTGNQSEEKAEHSDTKSDPKKQSMKRVWKRFFSSSLNCIRRRRKRLSKMSAMEDITFRNTQSAKFECDTDLAMSDTLRPEQEENALTTNHQGCRSVTRTAPFSVGIRTNITKQLNVPCHHKKTKRLSEQEIHFGYMDSHRPDLFFRKRIGRFLRHRPKKTSPLFHEQLEINQGYIDEEAIVLSNRHADDACQKTPPDMQEGNHSDGDLEASGSQSETMTVSVEVSVMGEGDREDRENNTDLEASAKCFIASGLREKEDLPGLAEAFDGNGRMADPTESSTHPELVMTDLLVEEAPGENLAVQGTVGSRLSTVDTREGQEDILGQDLWFLVDDTRISSCGLLKETVAHDEKVVEETIPQSRITDEDHIQDNLALRNVRFDGLLLCYDDTNRVAENGPEVSSEENLHAKDNGYKHSLHVEVLGSQCGDVLLVQTACRLVQVAMKAALDQLTKELKNKSAGIHAEYHEFQDDT
ncbi:hypothetical protein COCON_G00015620 [Conger conger]|uniref:Uncharacterized protein n=1 Tax=Conger conger TaxID=82655 RepID=A0A9Q1E3D9_CONCO|nr:hypothetical protein COCON_G00015620 [Conger conger]